MTAPSCAAEALATALPAPDTICRRPLHEPLAMPSVARPATARILRREPVLLRRSGCSRRVGIPGRMQKSIVITNAASASRKARLGGSECLHGAVVTLGASEQILVFVRVSSLPPPSARAGSRRARSASEAAPVLLRHRLVELRWKCEKSVLEFDDALGRLVALDERVFKGAAQQLAVEKDVEHLGRLCRRMDLAGAELADQVHAALLVMVCKLLTAS